MWKNATIATLREWKNWIKVYNRKVFRVQLVKDKGFVCLAGCASIR
jgi:hypothetical protein